MWTRFSWTGHGAAQPSHIYIEASVETAKLVFFSRLGHNPMDVSCHCCGEDYFIEEYDSLEEASADVRGCMLNEDTGAYEERYGWSGSGHYETLDEYILRDDVLVVAAQEITDNDLDNELPEPHYADNYESSYDEPWDDENQSEDYWYEGLSD